ncbi:MAG: cysteine synthase A [bacterium]|nr:cysteine synthase A [bacterium]
MGKPEIAKDVLGLIGNTPLVQLNRLPGVDDAKVLVKVECFNPGGSIKDRICLAMITDAEERGLLKPGGTIVEPTSGNTGIGLALVAAVKGYHLILTMPDTMSIERRKLLVFYGAEVILTPGEEGMKGSIRKASELKEKNGYYMPQQFNNPANPEIHRQTTAKEIIMATGGKLDAFIAGVGTGGTITGVGEVLKKDISTNIKIIAVEPESSAVLSGKEPGHHHIQGIGAGFIPLVMNTKIVDEVITVSDEDAVAMARRLAAEEGLLAGISAGANVFAALKVAKELAKGKTVVTILPDTSERYLSVL